MSYHHQNVQLPRGPPRRTELNVLKIDPEGNPVLDDDDPTVCDCFPRPSKKTIPSMLYDGIRCPHAHEKHIQPGQTSVFTYPWTASSDRDYRVRHTKPQFRASSKLSVIREQATPEAVPRHDNRTVPNVVRTAPPNAVAQTTYRIDPPFTAPAPGEDVRFDSLEDLRRAESAPEVTKQVPSEPFVRLPTRNSYLSEPDISTPYLDYSEPTHDRHTRRKEPFVGHYKDPKSGQIYSFQIQMNSLKSRGRPKTLSQKTASPIVR